jgi:hypothetical protein
MSAQMQLTESRLTEVISEIQAQEKKNQN